MPNSFLFSVTLFIPNVDSTLNTHFYHQLPPACFGVCYTIFRVTIALFAQKLQDGSNMTGIDFCVNIHKSVPVIFEPPCICFLPCFYVVCTVKCKLFSVFFFLIYSAVTIFLCFADRSFHFSIILAINQLNAQ